MRAMAASAATGSRTTPARHGLLKAVRLKKWLDPLESPLQRAHHAVLVARGQPRLPLVHPPRVLFLEHDFASSYQRGLSRRPARPWPGILALYAVIRVVFK